MFNDWCDIRKTNYANKKELYELREKEGGREAIEDKLLNRVRRHYDRLEKIEDDIKRLGYSGASALLRERMSQEKRMQSGEIGEILAAEFVKFSTDFRIPVYRLRYKDGRDAAIRGDDFIGINKNGTGDILFLKGESKSHQSASKTTIEKAREQLSDNCGHPTTISLLFVADRLSESENQDDQKLSVTIRDQVALKTVLNQHITHGLFIFSQSKLQDILKDDLDVADDKHNHISVGFQVENHQDFIKTIYEKVGNPGVD